MLREQRQESSPSIERAFDPARDYLGGPFADRSGGLITFHADSAVEAERLVANDPFLSEGLLERHWMKEWLLDR